MVSLSAFLFAIWSTVFSFGKVMLHYSPPLFLTANRMIIAGIFTLSYLFLFRRSSLHLERKQWGSIGLLALFSIYLTNVLEFWGLQYLSAAKTCFIYSLSPLLTACFSYFHFKEKMTPSKWVGLTIGFIGTIPVLLSQTGAEDLFQTFSLFSWPTLAVMGAVFFSVYGWILLRLIVKDQEISPLTANGSSMLLGGLFALTHSFFIENWHPIPVAAENVQPFIAGTLGMAFLYNIFCYNLYGFLLKRLTATFLSFVGLLSPIFASLSGWLLLGETPSPQIFISTAIVSLGLWIVYRAELKQGYIVQRKIT